MVKDTSYLLFQNNTPYLSTRNTKTAPLKFVMSLSQTQSQVCHELIMHKPTMHFTNSSCAAHEFTVHILGTL